MKSKAEVSEALRWFARVFVPQVGIDGTQAGQVITGLANVLCDEPDKQNPRDLPDGNPLPDPIDPTDGTKPSYWTWLDRHLDRPYPGPISYDRALPEDYLLPGYHQNPMRYALGPGWRGRKVRITVTDVTNGEPQLKQAPNARATACMAQAWEEGWTARDNHGSGGTANNPYHANYQGLKHPGAWPESWVEERKALFEENAKLRAELAYEKNVTWKPTVELKRDVAEAHQWRREVSERLHVSVEEGWPKLLERIGDLQADAEGHRRDLQEQLNLEREALTKWLTWGAKFIGAGQAGGAPVKTKEIFGRVTEIAETFQARLAALKERDTRNSQSVWAWMEWGRRIVGGIGLNSAQVLERMRQEVAALQQTARANELRANEAKDRVQYLERLLQERARCEPAGGHSNPLVRTRIIHIEPKENWNAIWETISSDCKLTLVLPEHCVGQKFRIEVARST